VAPGAGVDRCPAFGHDPAYLGLEVFRRGEQRARVEVALHRRPGSDAARRHVERGTPVDAHHVGPCLGHGGQQLAGTDTEVDPVHRTGAEPAQDSRRVGQHEPPVVGFGQGTGPGVEELDGLHPGVHLDPQELQGDPGEPGAQRVPDLRYAVHQRLGLLVVARRSTLDQVAGQRERRTGEPDQRRGAQLGAQQPDGLGHERHRTGGQRLDAGHVVGGADRVGHHRAGTGHDVEVDTGGRHGHHDVAEQDRGIHVVPPHGLQGDLADEIGAAARLEHGDAGAHLAVLRQRPAGLPHEPHGRVRDRLALAGPQKRIGHISVIVPCGGPYTRLGPCTRRGATDARPISK
jgi:hypothetical protein